MDEFTVTINYEDLILGLVIILGILSSLSYFSLSEDKLIPTIFMAIFTTIAVIAVVL